jgi:hypothetical protein
MTLNLAFRLGARGGRNMAKGPRGSAIFGLIGVDAKGYVRWGSILHIHFPCQRGICNILCHGGGALRDLRSAQLQRTGPMRRLCCSMAQSPIASRASAAIEICAHQRRSSARGRGKAGRVNCQGTRTELLWKRGTGTSQQPFFTAFAWVSSEPVRYFVWRKVLRQGQRPNAARRAA